MADDGLTLQLDAELSMRLKAAADAAGQAVDSYALGLIAEGLDEDWALSFARYAEYQRTGEYLDADVVLNEFREAIAANFREKRS
jgi:hypothetical protein